MARINRDRWKFVEHPSKPPITTEEATFFRKMVDKILKVGMEFEYNLPENKGGCVGNNDTCQCIHLDVAGCWKTCINRDRCEADKCIERCVNATDVCGPDDCAECDNFVLKCEGIACSSFTTQCLVCNDFQVDCNGCIFRADLNKDPRHLRTNIIRRLSPNKNYGVINKSGVHSVEPDGSLLGDGGAEVITIGRRLDFWEFFKMAKNVITIAKENGAYVDERCSTHMHLLASYYGKLIPHGIGEQVGVPDHISEMERNIPQIVLANFHQLVRKYHNALCWMGTGLDNINHMTRWEKFRVSVLDHSAILMSMPKVRDAIINTCPKNKYGFANYVPVEFAPDGSISRLHIEMRGLDNLMSPSATAAFACLYYALVIKAIEISRYGILEMESQEWMEQAQIMKRTILNNMKDYKDDDRFSDTRNVMEYKDIFIKESLDMVSQLKHILLRIGPAYEILEKIAEKPCSLRLINGDDWTKIESDLKVHISEETAFERVVNEIVDLRIVDHCKDTGEWITAAANTIRNNNDTKIDIANIEDRLSTYIEDSMRDGDIIWANKIGSVVRI